MDAHLKTSKAGKPESRRQPRKNVTLADTELQLIEAVRKPGSSQRKILESKLGRPLPPKTSESQSIRALVELAATVVEDDALDAGYAALAAGRDDEDRQYADAARARRASRAMAR